MRAFNREFSALASHAPDIPDSVLELAYSNGLKSKIRAGMKMFEPRNLDQMMKTAKKVEEWETGEEDSGPRAIKPISSGPVSSTKTTTTVQPQAQQQTKVKAQTNTTNPNQRGTGNRGQASHGRLKPPFRRLTPAEVEKWKAAGLCFKCDEKFHPNHPCAQAQLTVLILHPDGAEEELFETPCELDDDTEEVVATVAEVSINSVVGLASPRTMKLRGLIGDTPVVVLVDSGATHNFLSEKLIKQMGLTPSSTGSYQVLVAGGVQVQGKGVIKDVELKLPSCTVNTSFLPLELGIADVILGI